MSVYFIQQGQDGPVKVGTAKDLGRRMAGLQGANPFPLRLIGVLPGGRMEERAIHEKLSAWRIHGEWFQAAPEVLSVAAQGSLNLPTFGLGGPAFDPERFRRQVKIYADCLRAQANFIEEEARKPDPDAVFRELADARKLVVAAERFALEAYWAQHRTSP